MVDQSEGCISITNLEYQYPYVGQEAAEHLKTMLELQTKNDLTEYAIYTKFKTLIPRGLL